ncbi:MAG: hypothetical protein R3E87_12085 [Burkholderiaceae bacterium]
MATDSPPACRQVNVRSPTAGNQQMKTTRTFLAWAWVLGGVSMSLSAHALAETIELRLQATLSVARLPAGDALPAPWQADQKIEVVIDFESEDPGLLKRRPEIISNVLVKNIAFHKIGYRVRFGEPLVASFSGGAFSVGNGMVAFGIDPFGCGDGYRNRLLTSQGQGPAIETAAGRTYSPGRFVMTQAGFDNPDEPLGKVLERLAQQAARGQTKLAVQLFSGVAATTGPAMVFALSEPKLSLNPGTD